jgi:hypothetical protein
VDIATLKGSKVVLEIVIVAAGGGGGGVVPPPVPIPLPPQLAARAENPRTTAIPTDFMPADSTLSGRVIAAQKRKVAGV